MRTTDRTITYLKDYQPSPYLIPEIKLEFHLHPECTRVTAQLFLERQHEASSDLILDGNDLTIIDIKIDGKPLHHDDYNYNGEKLIIINSPKKFILETTVEISPAKNLALEGLYQSNGIYCTHCEPESFRNITFFIDRPDILSKYTTTIHADKASCPVLLSNGNCVASGATAATHWKTFVDPFYKPAYLFALVAGDLATINDSFITCSGKKVELKIFADKKHINQCQFALQALKHAMRWDEKKYGREYDLDQFYIVAIEDFNSGAMENKGLNIFNTACLLADPLLATDKDFMRVESVVAHEYFHNWSGNRVTCRDWFQLSLKEGFTVFREQQFAESMHSPVLQRIDDVMLLTTIQFNEDSSPLAHPVRPDSYLQISNFYTTTIYEKGAEVIRMLLALLGEEKFRQGTDLYFSRHDGQAVTTDDFVQAIADANAIDLTQFKRWYTQAGTPHVDVTENYDKATQCYQLNFTQHCKPTPKQTEKLPFMIPIKLGLIGSNGQELNVNSTQNPAFYREGSTLLLSEKTASITWQNIPEKPVPSLLRHFSAPVKLHFSYSKAQLLHLLKYDSDGFNQWQASRELWFDLLLSPPQETSIDTSSFNAYRELLKTVISVKNNKIDLGLIARIISLPTSQQLYERLSQIDVEKLEERQRFIAKNFADMLNIELQAVYQVLKGAITPEFDQSQVAKRALKNVCLQIMSYTDDAATQQLAMQQFTEATNMTDRLSALSAILNMSNLTFKINALGNFYQQYQQHALVIDAWFAAQARTESNTALDDIIQLSKHPAFTIKNPNRVRALIGVFTQQNLPKFHQKNGGGYRLLKETILRIDSFNPKIAARLVSPFSQWQKFDETRQCMMQQCLSEIKNTQNLSQDTFEMTEKCLSNR